MKLKCHCKKTSKSIDNFLALLRAEKLVCSQNNEGSIKKTRHEIRILTFQQKIKGVLYTVASNELFGDSNAVVFNLSQVVERLEY